MSFDIKRLNLRFHTFSIDETMRGRSRDLVHWRGFLTIYRGFTDADMKELCSGHFEVIAKKPDPEFSARFHVGTAGSETPFDGHLTVLGSGIYWGTSIGRKLADRITREKKHKWEGRDLQLSIHNGSLWIKAWVHPGTWERGEFAPWREKSIDLNPLTHLFGRKRYWYEPIGSHAFDIEMPEGSYPVVATLQRQLLGRPKLKRRVESLTVDVEADKGIPSHYDKSGGWKGDRTYGFSVPFRSEREDWQVDAKAAITAWVYQQRANSGFREPQAADA